MRILILVHNLTGGGAERVAASWANGLTARGHRVYVMSDFTQPVSYELDPSVERIQLPIGIGRWGLRSITRRVQYIFTLRKTLTKDNIDVILNILYIYPIITDIIRRGVSPRPLHIMTDHNVFIRPKYAPMPKRQKRNKFSISKRADLLTTLTDVDTAYMRSLGYKNVETLHNPLFLHPVLETPAKEPVVIAVGRLDVSVKGFDLLVKAWNAVGAMHPDWHLRIIGYGSEASIQKLRSLSVHPETIEIKPFTDSIVDEYRKAAVFVLSSRYEGWGLVLVEAMSQGCAALACNFGGRQAEIITDGVNGLLCQTDSVEAIAEGLERLISDDALRTRLQAAAPSSTVRFNEDATAERLESLIASIQD